MGTFSPGRRLTVHSACSWRFLLQLGVIEWFSQLWDIALEDAWGFIANGGTEANIQVGGGVVGEGARSGEGSGGGGCEELRGGGGEASLAGTDKERKMKAPN